MDSRGEAVKAVRSGHRLKVETNVDISMRSLFPVTSELPGDAASSTCNKTPPPSKRSFKASVVIAALRPPLKSHFRFVHAVIYWIKVSFSL